MTNQPTYLFYDIETTGLNKPFDQVLQFAAIRTTLQFKELDRTEIQVRLNNDVIPAPAAVITHRIGPKQFSTGLTEIEAIKQIHQLLNTPQTISVGYNTLGFDDEFLRFGFYKNLLPPYSHQYANGCGRMDIYPIVMMYYLFKPGHLKWPTTNNYSNLKLENLNACNQLASGQAHNAMVDVEVTLELAKRLAADETLWQYLTQYFKKNIDEQRIMQCDSQHFIGNSAYKIGFMAQGKFGSQANFIAPVIQCGQHKHYKNQTVWLRLDDEAIKLDNFPIKKRLAEPPLFLPFKERYMSLLSEERQTRMQNNLKWLTKNPEQFSAVSQHHLNDKYPVLPNTDTDAALYNIDFPTPEEANLFRQFHAASAQEKANIAEKIKNPIRHEQAIRILGRHYPAYLSPKQRAVFETYLTAYPIDFRGAPKLTKQKALEEIETLRQSRELDEEQIGLLLDLEQYFARRQ